MSLGFSELPEDIRVKLSEKGEKELWHRVNEFGGIKTFSQSFEYPSSKLYNWKSKEAYIPIELVRKVFGAEYSEEVTAYKGRGRSQPVKNPVFPLPENNELLTRIKCSVNLSKGTPIYQTGDQGLVERFQELLELYGEVHFKVYRRKSVYELRYPGYLHRIFQLMNYERDLNALIDEKGVVKDKIILEDEEIEPDQINELYHRDKRMRLALIEEDEKEITRLMSEEKKKVRELWKKS